MVQIVSGKAGTSTHALAIDYTAFRNIAELENGCDGIATSSGMGL